MGLENFFCLVVFLTIAGFLFGLFYLVFRVGKKNTCPVCNNHLCQRTDSCQYCGWKSHQQLSEFQLQCSLKLIDRAFTQNRISKQEQTRLSSTLRRVVAGVPEPKTKAAPAKSAASTMAPSSKEILQITDEPEIITAELIQFEPSDRAKDGNKSLQRNKQDILRSVASPVPAKSPTKQQPSATKPESQKKAPPFVAVRDATAVGEQPKTTQVVETERPEPRAKNFNEFLSAFLQEKNIRWGELVGGLLIVSCSIALVISFWSTISQQPIYKFGVFTAVTASFFALGMHAHRRWRLPHTSRVVLIIAMLLVPLNFLAIASVTEASQVNLVLFLGEILTIGLFGTLSYLAAKIVVDRDALPISISVVGLSSYLLLVRRFVIDDTHPTVLVLVTLGAVALFVVSVAGFWNRRWNTDELDSDEPFSDVYRIWTGHGLASFAFCMVIGFLFFRVWNGAGEFQWLAPGLCFAAIPSLICGAYGLFVAKKRDLKNLLVPATVVLLLSSLMIVGSVVVSWTVPLALVLTTICASVVLSLTFFAKELSFEIKECMALIVGAILLVPAVIVPACVSGNLSWSVATVWEVSSQFATMQAAYSLFFCSVVGIGVIASCQQFLQWPVQRSNYCLLALLGASVLLVTYFGFGNPQQIWPVTAIYLLGVAGTLTVSISTKRLEAKWLTAILFVAAVFQTVFFYWLVDANWAVRWVWTGIIGSAGLLAIEIIDGLISGGTKRDVNSENDDDTVRLNPLFIAALGMTLATALTIMATNAAFFGWQYAMPYLVVSTIFYVMAIRSGYRAIWMTASCVLFVGVVSCAYSLQHWLPWGTENLDWFSIDNLYTQIIVTAIFGSGWFLFRRLIGRFGDRRIPGRLSVIDLNYDSEMIGRTAMIASIVGGVVLAVYSAVPGMVQELIPLDMVTQKSGLQVGTGEHLRTVANPSSFELDGIAHLPGSLWAVVCMFVAIAGAIVCQARYSRPVNNIVLLGVALYALVFAIASAFESSVSVASALRWLLSGMFAIGCCGICWKYSTDPKSKSQRLLIRNVSALGTVCVAPLLVMAVIVSCFALQLRPATETEIQILVGLGTLALVGLGIWLVVSFSLAGEEQQSNSAKPYQALALAVLLGLPMFAFTVFVVGQGLGNHPITGPNADSIFSLMGRAANFSIPIVFVAVALLGTAVRTKNETIGFVGGLILNLSATTAYLLVLGKSGLSRESWIELAQLNSLVSGLVAIAWWYLVRRSNANRTLSHLWQAQFSVAFGFSCLATCSLVVLSLLEPTGAGNLYQAAGFIGWLSLFALGVCCSVVRNEQPALFGRHLVPMLITTFFVLLACTAPMVISGSSSQLLFAYLLISGLVAAAMCQIIWERKIQSRFVWSFASAVIVALFAIRLLIDIPDELPPVITLIASAVLLIAVSLFARNRLAMWLAAAAGQLAVAVTWWFVLGHTDLLDFSLVMAMALALPNIIWIPMIRRWNIRRENDSEESKYVDCPLPTISILLALSVISIISFSWIGLSLVFPGIGTPNHGLMALTILSVAIALYSNFWRRHSHWVFMGLFVLGLNVVSLFLQVLDVRTETLTWCLPAALSMFSLIASYVISRRVAIFDELSRYRLLPTVEKNELTKAPVSYIVAILAVTAIVVGVGFFAQFQSTNPLLRELAAQAILVQAVALAILIERDAKSALSDKLKSLFDSIRNIALSTAVLGAIAAGWSWLPADQWSMINRLAVIGAATSVLALVYSLILYRIVWFSDWQSNIRKFSPLLLVVSAMAVVATIAVEGYYYWQNDYTAIWLAAVATIGTLVVLTTVSLKAAFDDDFNAFGLQGPAREIYVYATQIFAVLFVIHIRLTWPALFSGWFVSVWPLLLLVVAFAMLGISHWSQRKGLTTIANPFRNSGVLVSLLPAVGYWALPSSIDYSFTLAMLSIGYGVVAVARRSVIFGAMAVITGNMAFWFLLHQQSIEFLEHPQIWLIPVSLLVLIAAQLNKSQLSAQQLTGIRYAAATAIYVSSTAEIFIHGVGTAPWLPVVLAALSIIGIGAGIGFQVRAFLWFGLNFLLVAMFTVIWYAAVDLQQTWIWYLCGIISGIVIITIFAIFEKRRNELLKWFGGLKQWER